MNKKSIDFVAKYYRHGALDVKSAYKKTLQKASLLNQPLAGATLVVVRHRRIQRLAIAASIAVLLAVSAVLLFRPSVTTLASADANKVFTLEDGTVVTLAPHSTLSYRGDCREVELTGKAYLDIHHDASHPFMIKDKSYVIKDIGTRLMVDESDRITVYVEEGCVALSASDNSSSAIVLKKDQGAAVAGKGRIRRLADASQNLTAWATHKFHFDNTPLPEVLHDLSDYYHVRLTCKSSEGKHLTADFQADSLQSIIEMIEETLNVKIE